MNTFLIDPTQFTVNTAYDALIAKRFLLEGRGDEVEIRDVDRLAYILLMQELMLADQSIPRINQRIGASTTASRVALSLLTQQDPQRIWSYRFGQESHWAELMLLFMKLQPFRVAVLSLEELGILNPDPFTFKVSSLQQKAEELGLLPCPQTLAAAFRFSRLSIPWGSNITIVSESVLQPYQDGDPKLFSLYGEKGHTNVSTDHGFEADVCLAELHENTEMYFSDRPLQAPDASKLGFMFLVSEELGHPWEHQPSLETEASLSTLLLEQNGTEEIPLFCEVLEMDLVSP